jgi:hypothetical protein
MLALLHARPAPASATGLHGIVGALVARGARLFGAPLEERPVGSAASAARKAVRPQLRRVRTGASRRLRKHVRVGLDR